jgi:hypothetical protein
MLTDIPHIKLHISSITQSLGIHTCNITVITPNIPSLSSTLHSQCVFKSMPHGNLQCPLTCMITMSGLVMCRVNHDEPIC